MLLNIGIVLRLLFLGLAGHASMMMAQGIFTATGSMTTARAGHTATLLLDGRVLIAGGHLYTATGTAVFASAELYDPTSGTFTATGAMIRPRYMHIATLLADGRVLIVGGLGPAPNTPFASADVPVYTAELYDPSTGTFTSTGATLTTTVGAATLLPSGEVLIAGGAAPPPFPTAATAELYDPAQGVFASTSEYAGSIFHYGLFSDFTATLLSDGRVLIAGGGDSSDYSGGAVSQLYDPRSGAFSLTGGIFTHPETLSASTATLLVNGRVLVAGGADDFGVLASAELYDASTGTFTPTGNMTTRRVSHTATLLPDGTVLMAGGGNESYYAIRLASADVYDPLIGTFSATGDMTMARFSHTATLLPDGTVLIAGGGTGYYTSTSSAELYRPPLLQAAPSLLSLSGDGLGQGAIQHADTYQVASSSNPAVAGEILSIYCTGLAGGSVIPPQVAIGGRLAEILFFGNTPGYAGLNQVNVQVPGGITPGNAVPVRLNYLGRPSNKVTIGVR
jgi:hypothetical protein